MRYYYPFGETLHPLVQQDRSPKKVFVLGVYASAVHARWKKDNSVICQALAVASEFSGMGTRKKLLKSFAGFIYQKKWVLWNLQEVT